MGSPGRPPLGPDLVDHLDAPEEAKARARVILASIAGELSTPEACRELGVEASRFHELKQEALAGMVAALAARPRGRPAAPADPRDGRIAELARENLELRADLHAEKIRTELALTLPHVLVRGAVKKGARAQGGRRKP